ncbi:hypothetical protein GIB67_000159 [Kingdonia uniflora]|uniref:DNA-directed DNA polymerase n=1 Tax=Kingdonia uniflora TaxID=39325 RepID=A0A7J7P9B7_9MAGN|nr:hypothetical protein GIB67_000159 [Kingdonia uniflora]
MGKKEGGGISWLTAVKRAFRSPTKKSDKSSNNSRREEHEEEQEEEEKKREKRRWIFRKPSNQDTLTQQQQQCGAKMSSVAITAPSNDSLTLLPGSLAELAKNLCPHLGVKGLIQHDKLRVSMLQNKRDQLLDNMRPDICLLAGAVMKAQEIYWTEYNIDITSCLTLSSLAMKIFRSRYYNDNEFPIHIPNRNDDEFFRSGYYGGYADMYKPYGKFFTTMM